MAHYAIVRDSDGYIEMVAEWDGESAWSPPAGRTAVLSDDSDAVAIDGWYDETNGFHRRPIITSVDPVSGGTAGGTTVTVYGRWLDQGTVSVKFDGVAATNLQNITNESLECDAPAHAAGSVDVTVENNYGTFAGQNTLASGFEYTA